MFYKPYSKKLFYSKTTSLMFSITQNLNADLVKHSSWYFAIAPD